MIKFPRPLFTLLLVCALPLLLSACVLRSLFGNVIIVADIEEEVNEIITTVFSDSTAAVCLEPGAFGFYECTYIIDGEIVTSTLYLLSEYGLTGVLIDPVIVQVPENSADMNATYDLGHGPEPLNVQIRQSFPVTPGTSIAAEAGTQFFILELPPSVTGSMTETTVISASYTLVFTQVQPINAPVEPVMVKVMLTGKATINEHDYYVPILPCVTDFALIPALEIPQWPAPMNLETAVGDLIRNGSFNMLCDHRAYTFNNVPPPPLKVFLPTIISN